MTIGSDQKHPGGCLCGAVRYSVTGAPVIVAHCHCRDCQRGGGAGHSTGAMFPVERFRISGDLSEFALTSDNGTRVIRSFCPTCGSGIFGRNDGMTGHVTIALGTLDDPAAFTPEVVVFARSRPTWDTMNPALPTFDDQPAWKPDDGA